MKGTQTATNKKMWFQKNSTLEERFESKLLGKVKGKLIDDKGAQPSEVKINWKTRIVKYKGNKVAWLEGREESSKLGTSGEATEFQKTITKEVQEWYNERKQE